MAETRRYKIVIGPDTQTSGVYTSWVVSQWSQFSDWDEIACAYTTIEEWDVVLDDGRRGRPQTAQAGGRCSPSDWLRYARRVVRFPRVSGRPGRAQWDLAEVRPYGDSRFPSDAPQGAVIEVTVTFGGRVVP